MSQDIKATLLNLSRAAREASLHLATLDSASKNRTLETMARLLVEHQHTLIAENRLDLEAGQQAGLSAALLDRLRLDEKRIQTMAAGVRQVAALPDPVGETLETTTRPNALEICKIRVPIGVVAIIYESRPNVTVDCAALCLKSGNAAILRGGKEAFHSNRALAGLLGKALQETGLPPAAIQLVPTVDRQALEILLKLDDFIHCVIPRGGEGLIRFVVEHARMPVIKHYKGVCNLYIDREAEPQMAEQIAINAKCQRPGVCNAIENLFVDRAVADTLLPQLCRALHHQGVTLKAAQGDTLQILRHHGLPVTPATEEDFYAEFLDLMLAVKLVDGLDDAIAHIHRYGSGHSDAIVTANPTTAESFLNRVDSATVYWNASTRFTDGFEFGLGAEIGISTDRLHARGPMGLRELCTYKFVIRGTGQIRA